MAQPRIRFMGDSETCVWLGVSFTRGQWRDNSLSAEQLARVDGHPHFEVEGKPRPAADKPKN